MITRRAAITLAIPGIASLASSNAHSDGSKVELPNELTEQWARDADAAKLTGLTVSVTRKGKAPTFWSHGFAELPFQTAMTETTLLPIGSITKHITALGVVRLKEAGALNLNDPIERHLKGTSSVWSGVTIRHLLTHTSGIRDSWNFFPDYDRENTRAEIMAKMAEAGPSFGPGEAYAYSSMNYDMLGWMIEDISGRPLAEFMQDQLFRGAGLKEARLDAAEEIIPLRAEGYEWREGRVVHSRMMTDGRSGTGAGGVLFSGLDAPRWEDALASNRLVSPGSIQESFSPAMLTTGRAVPYGFGWYLGKVRGQDYHWHGGSEPGYMGQYMRFPALGLSVFVSCNTFGPAGFLEQVPYQVAEHVKSNSTHLTLPDGEPDGRSRIIEKIFKGVPLEDSQLEPEAQKLKAFQHGKFGASVDKPLLSLTPVESFEMPGVEMVRYRARMADSLSHLVVGWSKADKITWILG